MPTKPPISPARALKLRGIDRAATLAEQPATKPSTSPTTAAGRVTERPGRFRMEVEIATPATGITAIRRAVKSLAGVRLLGVSPMPRGEIGVTPGYSGPRTPDGRPFLVTER